MAEDENGEKPAKLPELPKREGGSLYGTTLYVQLFCTYVQRLKYSTYVRTCTGNCITSRVWVGKAPAAATKGLGI